MKIGYTHIAVVLDRSGSMASIREDTVGGFNSFVADQKKLPGTATFTLVGFDDRYEVWKDFADLHTVEPLTKDTYVPRGSTALLDAIGRTVVETGERFKKLDESARPEKVVIVIITDGYENASRKYKMATISDMIREQTDTYKWQFLFLGANQDAIATAAGMNIGQANSLTYTANTIGVRNMFSSANGSLKNYRSDLTKTCSFTEDDRKKQETV